MTPRWSALPPLVRQLARYAVIGGGTTLLHSGMYAVLSPAMGGHPANVLAWVVCTLLSTVGHRLITFGLRRRDTTRDLLVGFSTSLVALGATSGALQLTGEVSGLIGGLLVFGVLTVVGCLRFLVLRLWFLGRGGRRANSDCGDDRGGRGLE